MLPAQADSAEHTLEMGVVMVAQAEHPPVVVAVRAGIVAQGVTVEVVTPELLGPVAAVVVLAEEISIVAAGEAAELAYMVVVQMEQQALLRQLLEAVAQVALMAAIKMVVCMVAVVVAVVEGLALRDFAVGALFGLFGPAQLANSLQLT